jgi:hypothetical protein
LWESQALAASDKEWAVIDAEVRQTRSDLVNWLIIGLHGRGNETLLLWLGLIVVGGNICEARRTL